MATFPHNLRASSDINRISCFLLSVLLLYSENWKQIVISQNEFYPMFAVLSENNYRYIDGIIPS